MTVLAVWLFLAAGARAAEDQDSDRLEAEGDLSRRLLRSRRDGAGSGRGEGEGSGQRAAGSGSRRGTRWHFPRGNEEVAGVPDLGSGAPRTDEEQRGKAPR